VCKGVNRNQHELCVRFCIRFFFCLALQSVLASFYTQNVYTHPRAITNARDIRYGANLFNVEQVSKKEWPKELWLAISLEGVGIFPRGERKCLAFHRYESVLSFGAPVANKYKIMVGSLGLRSAPLCLFWLSPSHVNLIWDVAPIALTRAHLETHTHTHTHTHAHSNSHLLAMHTTGGQRRLDAV
jgi:hypothetical protein